VSKRGLAQIVMVGGPGSYLTAWLINLVSSTCSVRNIYFPLISMASSWILIF